AAGGGQEQAEQAPVMDPQLARESRFGFGDVAGTATETLHAEVVRHAAGLDGFELGCERSGGCAELPQHETEAVAFQRAGLELAPVARGLQHLELAGADGAPIRLRPAV